jgi:hypothetical protein
MQPMIKFPKNSLLLFVQTCFGFAFMPRLIPAAGAALFLLPAIVWARSLLIKKRLK